MPYEVIHKPKRVSHPFGHVEEIYRTDKYNIARAEITDDREHYHKKATEVYHVVSGNGRILLDGKSRRLRPGTTVVIHPWTSHRATADEGALSILVFSSPPYDPRDEYPVNRG